MQRSRPVRVGPEKRREYIGRINQLFTNGIEFHQAADYRGLRDLIREALGLAQAIDDIWYTACCYEKLGMCHRMMEDLPTSLRYAKKAYALFRKLPKDHPSHWDGHGAASRSLVTYGIGSSYMMMGEYEEAEKYMRLACDYGREANHAEWIGAALTGLGTVRRLTGNYAEAIAAFIESREYWEKAGSVRGPAVAYLNIGTVHYDLGDWQAALDAFRKGERYNRAVGFKRDDLVAAVNLAACLLKLGRTADALRYLKRAVRLNRELGYELAEIFTMKTIAAFYLELGTLERALAYAMKALHKVDQYRVEAHRPMILVLLCGIHAAMGRPECAIPFGLQGLEAAIRLNMRHEEQELTLLLARTYERISDPATAIRYYRRYLELEEDLAGPGVRRAVVTTGLKIGVRKIKGEKEELQKKVDGLAGEIERKSKELMTLALRLNRKDEIARDIREKVAANGNGGAVEKDTTLTSLVRQLQEGDASGTGWSIFERQFHELHHDFIGSLSQSCPLLTPMELKVCSLLRAGMTSKTIADILALSFNTVNTHRYNIRAKLGLDGKANLATFLAGL